MRSVFLYIFGLSFALIGCCNTKDLRQRQILPQKPFVNDIQKSEIIDIISKEEKNNGIPRGLLKSIAAVESNHSPYAVNAKSKSHNFRTKIEAVNFIDDAINQGFRNFSIGCLQIHYKTHSNYFSSIEEMLQPEKNIAYGATLLKKLYKKYGSWEKAVKMYHAKSVKLHNAYYKKIMKKFKNNLTIN